MTSSKLGFSVVRAERERARMSGGRIGAVSSGQAILGFVGCTRVAIKEQSNGILFFTSYKDHLDCYAGN